MTLVSDDPGWGPSINSYRVSSYFVAAASVGVVYDWTLTFGQEIELIWRQRWSLMTVLYLSVRYLGIFSAIIQILIDVPTIPVTDAGCFLLYVVWNWTNVAVFLILEVILITRLHAMYQRSRKILIFLVVTFLAVNILNGVVAVISTRHISGEEYILFDTYECDITYAADVSLLESITWILATVWEVLALCLAVWNAVQHFRELRQHSAGGIIGDCYTVLVKSHAFYFASFVAVSCFNLILFLSPTISTDYYFVLETQVFLGLSQIFEVVQMFVLGPRLILGVREYHAKLVVDSDATVDMTSIAFQEHVHISTGSGV